LTLTSEILVQYTVRERPQDVMAAWQRQPPAWVGEGDYRGVDESFETLVYERRHTPRWARVFGLNWFGGWESVYRVSIRFDAAGAWATKVTISGRADERARAAIRDEAERTDATA